MTDHAEAKRKQRKRMRKDGYVLKQVWAKPEWWDKVLKKIKQLDK